MGYIHLSQTANIECEVFVCVCVCLGWVMIDRSGKYFGTILNYLRDGSVSLPEAKKECEELLAEAK